MKVTFTLYWQPLLHRLTVTHVVTREDGLRDNLQPMSNWTARQIGFVYGVLTERFNQHYGAQMTDKLRDDCMRTLTDVVHAASGEWVTTLVDEMPAPPPTLDKMF